MEQRATASDLLGLLGEEKVYLCFSSGDNRFGRVSLLPRNGSFLIWALDFLLAQKERLVIANVSGSRLLLHQRLSNSMIQSFSVGERKKVTNWKIPYQLWSYQRFLGKPTGSLVFERSVDLLKPVKISLIAWNFGDEIDGIRTFLQRLSVH